MRPFDNAVADDGDDVFALHSFLYQQRRNSKASGEGRLEVGADPAPKACLNFPRHTYNVTHRGRKKKLTCASKISHIGGRTLMEMCNSVHA
jgi:hypothetical protein